MVNYSLRARWVLTVDRPPIAGGYVKVVDGQIAEVSSAPPAVAVVEDLGDVVLLPGLVNAHTHLEFGGLAAPLGSPGMSLPNWIRLVIAERNRGNRDAAREAAIGLAESLAGGVTTIGEISSASAKIYETGAARPSLILFHEAIGFSAQRVESVLGDVERRLVEAPESGVSPHAPYTVHPALVEQLVGVAATRGVPIAMHLAESREELQLLEQGGGPFRELLEERSMWDGDAIVPGSRPLDYLRMLAAAPRAIVVHGNYLSDEEIEFIGKRRATMSVVYCPRTHDYFGHAPYPLERMLAAGARVVLGTDSRASNPDHSLLGEVRLAAKRFPRVDASQWLKMATIDAATALGRDDAVGSLNAGKRADLVAVPCTGDDPLEALVYGEEAPTAVWLAGTPVA